MDYYIDIIVLPDNEMPINRLLNALYAKLHKYFYDMEETSVGISFPACKMVLGNCIRLHGSKVALEKLHKAGWIGGLIGYCRLSELLLVPTECKHRTVSRIQTSMSLSKLKRLIKRGSIKEEEIKAYKAKLFTKGLDNPYLELQSTSNGHKHRRYIAFGELQDKPVAGSFDSFGLSKTATIPWF